MINSPKETIIPDSISIVKAQILSPGRKKTIYDGRTLKKEKKNPI